MNPDAPISKPIPLFVLVQSDKGDSEVVCVVDCFSVEEIRNVSCTISRTVKQPPGKVVDISDTDFQNPTPPHFIGHFDSEQWMALIA